MKKKYIYMSLIVCSLSNAYIGETVLASSNNIEFQTNNDINSYLKKSDKIIRDTSEYPYEIENIYDFDENEYFSLQPKSDKENTDISDEAAADTRISWLLKNYQEDQQFSQDLSKEEQKAATQIAIWHYTAPETTPISSQIIQDNPSIKNLIEEADKYKNDSYILNTNMPKISSRSVRSNENTYEITYTINNAENNDAKIDSIKYYVVNQNKKRDITNTEGLDIVHDDSGTHINLTIDNELADSFGEDALFELEVNYNLECESYSGKVYNTSKNSNKKQKQNNQLLLGIETNTIKTKTQLSDSCEIGKGDSDTSYDQDQNDNSSCDNNDNDSNNSQGNNSSCGNNGNDSNNSQGNNSSCDNNDNDSNNSQGNNSSCGNNDNDSNNSDNVIDNKEDYDINVEDATGGLVDNTTETNDSYDNINEVDSAMITVEDADHTDNIIYEVDNASGNNTTASDDTAVNDDFSLEVDNNINENYLPNTGTKNTYILSALGSFLLVLIAGVTYQKKKSF